MHLDDQMMQLLLGLGVIIIALAIAALACLLLGGKAERARISAWLLMMMLIFPLYAIRMPLALHYYGLLFADALFEFVFLECCLIGACSVGLEWLSPSLQRKSRTHRNNLIFSSILVVIACIMAAIIFLPRMTAFLADMATGPSVETGAIEQLTLRQTRGLVSGGDFVVRGISYFTADLPWYKTLSVGQPAKFAYGPASHYGFPADQMIATPLGMVVPLVVIGIVLLIFSVGYLYLRLPNTPTRRSLSETSHPFEPVIANVAEYRRIKGWGPMLVLMILPLLIIGLVLLFLTAPFR